MRWDELPSAGYLEILPIAADWRDHVGHRLAERLLVQQAHHLGLAVAQPAGETTCLPFSGIFAVGDNPAADVRGANAAGPPWVSCLVRTGG